MTTDPGTHIHYERMEPGPSWDGNYPDHSQRYEFVASMAPRGARVLDAGCGCGYGSAILVDKAECRVTAVDIVPRAMEIARSQFHRESIYWMQDDCHSLQEEARNAPFDVICNLENIEHLHNADAFLSSATRLMTPRGILITSTPNRRHLERANRRNPHSKSPFHHIEYTKEEFQRLLSPYFEEIQFWYQSLTVETVARLSLEPALYALWYNPVVRLGVRIQRLLGRKVPDLLRNVLPPREWEILEHDPGDERAWTFLVVCRKPRGAH